MFATQAKKSRDRLDNALLIDCMIIARRPKATRHNSSDGERLAARGVQAHEEISRCPVLRREDRDYVDKVAKRLQEKGVKVFYDKFEETNLWGKDLYAYFSDVYQNQAFFTIMFISEDYRRKLWTNHERRNAQARAFSENREYILPGIFRYER